jgi:glycosyltransferase involved in cell wall biosynthesis
MRNCLLLFTQSFPYGADEVTFLGHELTYLMTNFDRVVIIPKNCSGRKINIQPEIKIDESFSEFTTSKRSKCARIYNGLGRLFIIELLQNVNLLARPKQIYKLLFFIDRMKETIKWYSKTDYYGMDCTYYSYWFDHVPAAFTLLEKKENVITRVHGIDLYLERNEHYIPLRKTVLKHIKNVHCVSDAGKRYLYSQYPEYDSKIMVNRLGVARNGYNIQTHKPTLNHWVIVSCSSVIELKRVKLIMESVITFSKQNPSFTIEYTHFGDGPLMNELRSLKNQSKLANLKIFLPGFVENENIVDFYKSHYVDIFINASTTEGGVPVSLQEAQSYGVPIICTNVGGNPEVLYPFNLTGFLVSSNPSANEIAEVMNKFSKYTIEEMVKFRKNSYSNWNKKFNAANNFREFAEFIAK